MCLILDANKYGTYLDQDDQDMQPVRDWMKKRGKMVYVLAGKMKEELKKHKEMEKQVRQYNRRGRLKTVTPAEFHQAEKEVKKLQLQSNDPHIIALAKAANVKLLVSSDKDLHKDFKNRQIIENGKIYQKKAHKDLLQQRTCP